MKVKKILFSGAAVRSAVLGVAVIVFFTGVAVPSLQAQAPAEIQLAVAAPDPAKAGDDISFQIIVLNKETAAWDKADINCIVELFDSDGKYIGKTQGFKLPADVPRGGSSLILATHRLPFSYSGRYQFRVMLYKKGQNILTSPFYDFSVRAASVERKKDKPLLFSGNLSLLYRNSSRADYQGSVSANILGKLHDRTLIFNSNAYSSADDGFDLDSVYMSLFSGGYKISIGDVMPEFSPLSLYSLAGRGITADYMTSAVDFSGAYIQTQEALEGDASSNGIYARYTGGLNASLKLPAGFGLKLSGVQSYDSESSVTNPGPDNSSVSNNVVSSELRWSGAFMDVRGEFATSSRSERDYDAVAGAYANVLSTTGAAQRLETRFFTRKFNLTGRLQKTDADFLNLASPGLYPDRKSSELSGAYSPLAFLRFSGALQSSEDNLESDPDRDTTTQSISNYGFQLNVRNFPGISLSSTLNKVEGSSVTVLSNETKGLNAGISYRIGKQMFSAGFSNSAFRNFASTATGHDLDTGVLSFSYSGGVASFLSFDAGYTSNETKNLYDLSIDETVSLSLGANLKFSQRLNLFLYGSKTSREKLADNVKTDTQNYSAEMTYSARRNLSVTGGLSIEKNDDTDPAEDYSSTGYLFRLHYSF